MNSEWKSFPFCWKRLDIRLEGSVFLSVRELNELRRNGFDLLKRALTEQFRREQTAPGDPDVRKSPKERERTACRNYAMVESWEQLGAVMSCPAVDGIDVSIHALTLDGRTGEHMEEFEETAGKLHRQGRFIALVLPYILRMRDKKRLAGILCSLAPVLDSLVVKNIESLAFVKTIPQLDKIPIRTDYTAYAMNGASICQWGELGVSSVTLPVELNRYELGRLAGASVLATELVIYGHMPMMVSAQCVVRNTIGCQGQRYPVRIRDRKKQLHYVQNYCDNCYNVIYNDEPFSLLDCLDETEAFGLSVRKLHFTVETATQTRQVLDIFTDNYINGAGRQPETFTRGHWKRGVE